MPKSNSKLRKRDPFVMNEDMVNRAVADFLEKCSFKEIQYLSGNSKGVDVAAKKGQWTIYIESKGSHANKHNSDTIFQTKQIKVHTYNQIGKLLEYKNSENDMLILALANPDIPRIRDRVNKVSKSLDILRLIRFWVQEDRTVKVEYPENCTEILRNLGLIS